jgi:hypothetical protein
MTTPEALRYLSDHHGAIEFSREGCRATNDIAVRIVIDHHEEFFTIGTGAFVDGGAELIGYRLATFVGRVEREERLRARQQAKRPPAKPAGKFWQWAPE